MKGGHDPKFLFILLKENITIFSTEFITLAQKKKKYQLLTISWVIQYFKYVYRRIEKVATYSLEFSMPSVLLIKSFGHYPHSNLSIIGSVIL